MLRFRIISTVLFLFLHFVHLLSLSLFIQFVFNSWKWEIEETWLSICALQIQNAFHRPFNIIFLFLFFLFQIIFVTRTLRPNQKRYIRKSQTNYTLDFFFLLLFIYYRLPSMYTQHFSTYHVSFTFCFVHNFLRDLFHRFVYFFLVFVLWMRIWILLHWDTGRDRERESERSWNNSSLMDQVTYGF